MEEGEEEEEEELLLLEPLPDAEAAEPNPFRGLCTLQQACAVAVAYMGGPRRAPVAASRVVDLLSAMRRCVLAAVGASPSRLAVLRALHEGQTASEPLFAATAARAYTVTPVGARLLVPRLRSHLAVFADRGALALAHIVQARRRVSPWVRGCDAATAEEVLQRGRMLEAAREAAPVRGGASTAVLELRCTLDPAFWSRTPDDKKKKKEEDEEEEGRRGTVSLSPLRRFAAAASAAASGGPSSPLRWRKPRKRYVLGEEHTEREESAKKKKKQKTNESV